MTPQPSMPMPPPAVPSPQGSWFNRNWKWLVPVACGVPLLCCGFFGSVLAYAVGKMKDSPAYLVAVTQAVADPDVQQALGEPISPSLFPQGSVDTRDGRSEADLTIGLTGTRGQGTLHVKGTGTGMEWDFTVLEVTTPTGVIDLLGGAADPGEDMMDEPDLDHGVPEHDEEMTGNEELTGDENPFVDEPGVEDDVPDDADPDMAADGEAEPPEGD